ncbi:MAG: hypothetical protein ACT4OS_05575 [Acidimicrobiales bacterium]
MTLPVRRGPAGLLRAPRAESLFVAAFVLLGLRIGVRPLADNSLLTHLRTGLDMVTGSGIPRVDPYSFTATGQPWVVQSWLPEMIYGWTQRLGGLAAVMLLQGLLTAALAWLLLRLSRTGSPLRTTLAGAAIVLVGAPFWSPRPLMFGLVAMALTVTVVERRRSPWLLIPVVWLWVNSHGSFVLGLVYLLARAAGEWRDWKSWPAGTMKYAAGFAAGLVAAAINPLGPRLLAFPFTLAGRREVFSRVVEWQSPNFSAAGTRMALVGLALALGLLIRWRAPWRDAVPVVIFVALGLLAVRNLPVAAVVLAPTLARAIRHPDTRPAAAPVGNAARANLALVSFLVLAGVASVLPVLLGPALKLSSYPVAAVDHLDEAGLLSRSHRLASTDRVGNYLQYRYGRDVKVFIDDRVDMYPVEVSDDYAKLLAGHQSSREILGRHDIDVVLWRRDLPLAAILAATGGRWQQIYLDESGWVVFSRMELLP